MEAFSALLAICAGNSPDPGEFPHKGQWRGALMFSLICVWINGWVNNHEAGDLWRHLAHYDVTLMTCPVVRNPSAPWCNLRALFIYGTGNSSVSIKAYLHFPRHLPQEGSLTGYKSHLNEHQHINWFNLIKGNQCLMYCFFWRAATQWPSQHETWDLHNIHIIMIKCVDYIYPE